MHAKDPDTAWHLLGGVVKHTAIHTAEAKAQGGKPGPESGFSTHIAGQKPSYIDAAWPGLGLAVLGT